MPGKRYVSSKDNHVETISEEDYLGDSSETEASIEADREKQMRALIAEAEIEEANTQIHFDVHAEGKGSHASDRLRDKRNDDKLASKSHRQENQRKAKLGYFSEFKESYLKGNFFKRKEDHQAYKQERQEQRKEALPLMWHLQCKP